LSRTKRRTKSTLTSMSSNSPVLGLDSKSQTRCKLMPNLKAKIRVTSNNKIEELKKTTMMMMTKKKYQVHTIQLNTLICQ
jgi:hypothetical protein